MREFPCKVQRVIDGDTFVADIDLGFGIGFYGTRCRMANINCPELHEPKGQEAKEFVEKEIKDQKLILKSGSRRDKYGRELVQLWSRGMPVADALVVNGLAVYCQVEESEE